MDKTTQYRRLIKNLLTQHANIVARQCTQEMNTLLSFDEEHDQYLWLQEIIGVRVKLIAQRINEANPLVFVVDFKIKVLGYSIQSGMVCKAVLSPPFHNGIIRSTDSIGGYSHLTPKGLANQNS